MDVPRLTLISPTSAIVAAAADSIQDERAMLRVYYGLHTNLRKLHKAELDFSDVC